MISVRVDIRVDIYDYQTLLNYFSQVSKIQVTLVLATVLKILNLSF